MIYQTIRRKTNMYHWITQKVGVKKGNKYRSKFYFLDKYNTEIIHVLNLSV